MPSEPLEAAPGETLVVDDALQRDWILCALVAAAARFVPVPLLDDVVKGRATRTAVERTLRCADRRIPVHKVAPLYETGSWLGFVARLPFKLILYPVRKIVRVVGAVHGVPTDLLETFLLARALHRSLATGAFPPGMDDEALRKEAKLLRAAFDEAFSGMNLKVVSVALGQTLGQLKDLGATATRLVQGMLQGEPGSEGGGDLDEAARAEAEKELDEVEQVLERPDVLKTLAEFDRRFDQARWTREAEHVGGR